MNLKESNNKVLVPKRKYPKKKNQVSNYYKELLSILYEYVNLPKQAINRYDKEKDFDIC